VALVRTDVSEKNIAYIIRVTRIRELGTTLAVTSNRSTLPHGITFHKTAFLRPNYADIMVELDEKRKISYRKMK
jgi:hypothetical protein